VSSGRGRSGAGQRTRAGPDNQKDSVFGRLSTLTVASFAMGCSGIIAGLCVVHFLFAALSVQSSTVWVVQVAPIAFERQIDFEGCFNFRDLGGYATRDGRWVRPQRLYRADGPHALTPEDGVKVRALELATVIDLRTPQEVHERGCYVTVLADVVEYHLPMTDVLPTSTSSHAGRIRRSWRSSTATCSSVGRTRSPRSSRF
jgi:Tyrosine phosphatase family